MSSESQTYTPPEAEKYGQQAHVSDKEENLEKSPKEKIWEKIGEINDVLKEIPKTESLSPYLNAWLAETNKQIHGEEAGEWEEVSPQDIVREFQILGIEIEQKFKDQITEDGQDQVLNILELSLGRLNTIKKFLKKPEEPASELDNLLSTEQNPTPDKTKSIGGTRRDFGPTFAGELWGKEHPLIEEADKMLKEITPTANIAEARIKLRKEFTPILRNVKDEGKRQEAVENICLPIIIEGELRQKLKGFQTEEETTEKLANLLKEFIIKMNAGSKKRIREQIKNSKTFKELETLIRNLSENF